MLNKLSWKRKRDGAAVEHTLAYKGFNCVITNYPGSYSLEWQIKLDATDWSISRWEDRRENTVKILKEKCLEKCEEILIQWAKNKAENQSAQIDS